MKKNLYIIGNGFDLHHGIRTNYADFGKFLKEKDLSVYANVVKYIFHDDEEGAMWLNFEECLGNIEPDNIFEDSDDFYYSYADDDWSDSYNHSYQKEIKDIINDISINTKKYFLEWINGISTKIKVNIFFKDKDIANFFKQDSTNIFLNFNYTPTLQNLYEIPKDQIIFLHGEYDDEKLVLGHAIHHFSVTQKQNWEATQFDEDGEPTDYMDFRNIDAHNIINDFFKQTHKRTNQLIKEHLETARMQNFDHVYTIGHSLSDVDLPYIKHLINRSTNNTHWFFSYYSEDDYDRALRINKEYNLKANYFKLQEIHSLIASK